VTPSSLSLRHQGQYGDRPFFGVPHFLHGFVARTQDGFPQIGCNGSFVGVRQIMHRPSIFGL
jgi:hypothetical protein